MSAKAGKGRISETYTETYLAPPKSRICGVRSFAMPTGLRRENIVSLVESVGWQGHPVRTTSRLYFSCIGRLVRISILQVCSGSPRRDNERKATIPGILFINILVHNSQCRPTIDEKMMQVRVIIFPNMDVACEVVIPRTTDPRQDHRVLW